MNKSFFLYLHNDLSGNSAWKKVGIGMTPYSVVRSRQKFCSDRFGLTHLFFGDPSHIAFLEKEFKDKFFHNSGTYINKISAQTELFNMAEEDILLAINNIIKINELHIKKLDLAVPYSAANSGECPYNIPSEAESYNHLRDLIIEEWDTIVVRGKTSKASIRFSKLFEEVE
jgi:hypothetical protein